MIDDLKLDGIVEPLNLDGLTEPVRGLTSAPTPGRPTTPHLAGLLGFLQEKGLTPGSTTGGRHNVGSRHYTGNAVDIKGSGGFSDEQVAALTQEAASRGFKIRDERRRPPNQKVWGGPHVHLEYVGASQAPTSVADGLNLNGLVEPLNLDKIVEAVAPGGVPLPPQSVALTTNDAAWHFGMTPDETRRLGPKAQQVLSEAVAEDQRKRAAGETIQRPSLKYQNEMRAAAGLKPLKFNIAVDENAPAPFYSTQGGAFTIGEKPQVQVKPRPFTFAEPSDEDVKASIRNQVVTAARAQNVHPEARSPMNVTDIESITNERFNQYLADKARATNYAQLGPRFQGRNDRVERLMDVVKQYAPDLGIDKPGGIKTDVVRGAARGLGVPVPLRDVTPEERLLDPQADATKSLREFIGQNSTAFLPFIGAGKLVSAAGVVNPILRDALTFGIANATTQLTSTGTIDPQQVAETILTGGLMGKIAGINPSLKRRLVAYIAPQLAIGVAKGETKEQLIHSAITNGLFALAGGTKEKGGVPEPPTAESRIDTMPKIPDVPVSTISKVRVIPKGGQANARQIEVYGETGSPSAAHSGVGAESGQVAGESEVNRLRDNQQAEKGQVGVPEPPTSIPAEISPVSPDLAASTQSPDKSAATATTPEAPTVAAPKESGRASDVIGRSEKANMPGGTMQSGGGGTAAQMPETKVVDTAGKPLVMRHGSTTEFGTFDKTKIRADDYDAPFNGFWFTSGEFASPAFQNPKFTKEVYLDIRNPAPITAVRDARRQAEADFDKYKAAGARSYGDATRMVLQEKGYDGVIWEAPPQIDLAAFERDGRVKFTDVRGRKSELRKDPDSGGVDLYEKGEHITGYESVQDFLNQQDTIAVAFEPEQIKLISPTGTEPSARQPETAGTATRGEGVAAPKPELAKPWATVIEQRADQLTALRESAATGDRHDFDLADDLKSGLDRASTLKQQGVSIKEATDADPTLTPFQRQTTQLFEHEPEIVGRVLDNYLKGAELAGIPQEKAFFEKNTPTKEALLEAATREAVRDVNKEGGISESEGVRPEPETSGGVPNADQASQPTGEGVPEPNRIAAGGSAGEAPLEVSGLVEPAETPANPQAGKIDVDLLTLGIRPFGEDVLAKAKRGIESAKTIADAIRGLVAPSTRSPEAKSTALSVRANTGEMQRQQAIAERSLDGARKYFASQKPVANYDFIDRMERGQAQADPKTQAFADTLRQMLDLRRDQIRSLGTGKLETFIDDYFPHIWKDSTKASAVFSAEGRRPFEGRKTFLKQRTIPLTSEGLALGLEPVSDNPVDLAILKLREMDKYLMAHRVLGEMKDAGTLQFFKMSQPLPDGWKQIDDRVSTVYSRGDQGELILRGRYAAPEPAAKIINNYLSPGLEATALREPFKAWRGTANFLNQFQLGFSAFHAGFTTLDAAISRVAVGLEDVFQHGKPIRGLKTIASAPISPVTNLIQGSKMLREYYASGSQGAEIGQLVDGLTQGGGRAAQDRFYTNQAVRGFTDAMKQGNLIGGALRAPGAAIEVLAKPTMEFLVPRQKLGVFAELAKREIERLGPDAGEEAVRAAMSRAWDSVDNRMGQMVYDNLFWHKITKDLAMSSVRSVGWNLGTAREVGGGILDYATLPARAIKGGTDPLFTHRMAYAAALPLVVGTMGAMTQYLLTGKRPEELKDYFFPQTGNMDENGNPERIAFPSYMKDIFPLADRMRHGDVSGLVGTAAHMVTSKAHPLIGVIGEMLANKDYYGTEIRHSDDPFIQQLRDTVRYAESSFVPFAVRGYAKERERDAAAWRRLLPFVGVVPAPGYINKSPAETFLADKMKERIPEGSRTKQEFDRSRLKYQIESKIRRGVPAGEDIEKAVAAGTFTQNDVKSIITAAQSEPIQLRFAQVANDSLEDALTAYNMMTPEEKAKVRPVLAAKRLRLFGMDAKTGRSVPLLELRGSQAQQQSIRDRLDKALEVPVGVPRPPTP